MNLKLFLAMLLTAATTTAVFPTQSAFSQFRERAKTPLNRSHYDRYCVRRMFLADRNEPNPQSKYFNSQVYVENTTNTADGWQCVLTNPKTGEILDRQGFNTQSVCSFVVDNIRPKPVVRRDNWGPEGWVCYSH